MTEKKILLDYSELLQVIGKDSSLLLGNGFNISLGVSTSYKNIFDRMKENNSMYNLLAEEFVNVGSDLEILIGKLQDTINSDNKHKQFLNLLIEKKVKSDFMVSAYSIVNENIKNIYQENKDEIYLFFNKFQNYFTLNYDPLLYLLLLKFKNVNNPVMAFQINNNLLFNDLKNKDIELFNTIKDFYESGKLTLEYEDNQDTIHLTKNLNDITKSDFLNQTKKLFRAKYPNKKVKEIKKIAGQFFDSINPHKNKLDVFDGFQGELFNNYKSNSEQNVFFLHGSFHIYSDDKKIKKIIKPDEKSFNEKIEEIIEQDSLDLVCIFKANNKEDDILNNEYLTICLNKINEIKGDLVIFGTALSENDSHIFSRINKNNDIERIFISTCVEQLEDTINKSKTLFPNKMLEYFDYKTVTYN